MMYGLYLSATGVLTNAYRQDVIANNLANSETVGFKRDTTSFQSRLTAAQLARDPDPAQQFYNEMGGGLFGLPTGVNLGPGDIEATGKGLDVAIQGRGFFAVDDGGTLRLTRAGQFVLDVSGNLVMASGSGARVLDAKLRPINAAGISPGDLQIMPDGTLLLQNSALARVGLFDVPEPTKITKRGQLMLNYPDLPRALVPAAGMLRGGFVERSNVDPANELVDLIETQRELEANANMIRYQDQTLGRLVNDVGKIS